MFEQSVVIEKKQPWSIAFSLTLQSAAVAAILLWSILHVESLGPILLPDPLPPLRRGSVVKVVDVQRSAGPASAKRIIVERKPFTAPTRIPPAAMALATVIEAPDASSYGGGPGVMDGVPGPTLRIPEIISSRPKIAEPPPASKPVSAKPASRVPVGGDVLEAQIIKRVIPEYPPLARQMRLSGVVQLVGIIDREGNVKSLQVLGGHPMLVKAAVDAVSQWKYRPTLLNHEPVEVIAPITVNFTLAR
jgi:periplasmic protein TonB